MLYSSKSDAYCWNDVISDKSLQVGFVKGYSYGAEWNLIINRHRPNLAIQYDPNNFPTLIAHHRIDAYIKSEITGEHQLNKINMHSKITSCPTPIYETPWHLGVSRKSPLASKMPQINAILSEMKKDGTLEKILPCNGCMIR